MPHARCLARTARNRRKSSSRQENSSVNADVSHGQTLSDCVGRLQQAYLHLPAQVEISIDQFFS
jgi:hypothetical protein